MGSRGWIAAALLAAPALMGTLAGGAVHAAEHGMRPLLVTATVQRLTTIRLDAPQVVTISDSDVARGYIEVSAPVEVAVESNTRGGYTLALQQTSAMVRETVVQGPGGSMAVGDGGGFLSRPPTGTGRWRDVLQLRVRFQLSAQARAGTYAWPLVISMVP